MNSAINYFLTQIPSVASDNCVAYFDFESGQNSNILYNKSGNLNLIGSIINQNPLFWSIFGSGFFTQGTYAEVTGINNIINNKDFTICFTYENKSAKGSTLISTIDTGVFISYDIFGNEQTNLVYKGFNFGITANNRLFFEYYNSNGPNIFTSNFTLSDKNSIFLSITENNLSFGYYDFFTRNLISNNHYISTDYLFDYANMFIGYNPKTSTGIYNFNRNYTGYIDEFLIFSPSIYSYDIVNLNSGFVHNYSSGNYFNYENFVTGVTGYLTGVTGYATGVTGTVIIQTGTAYDEFGVEYSLYYESGITGVIPQYDIIELTGVIASEFISGFSGQGIFLNTKNLESFGKQKINLLSNIRSGDILDVNLITKINKPYLLKNISLNYQRYSDSFTLPDFSINLDNPIVYVNGQLQHSGIFYQTGNIYNLSQYVVNDYYLNEFNNFLFANRYNESDSVFIDLTTGYNQNLYIENFSITGGSGILELTGWNGLQNNIYFNGQKLINGIHYKTLYSEEYQTLTGSSLINDGYGGIFKLNHDGSILFVGAPNSNSNRGLVYIYKNTGDGYKLIQAVNGKNIINDYFGRSAISCDFSGRLFATDSFAGNNGEVHIYKTNDFQSWSLIQTLSGDYPINYIGDAFGYNAIQFSRNGNTLVIGSAYDSNQTGAAWIYTGDINNKWILTQKITGFVNQRTSPGVGPNPYAADFTNSISINDNGTTLFIAAQLDTENNSDYAGSVSIYTGTSGKFNFSQKIFGDPSGLSYGDLFGRSIGCDSDGNTLAVGSLHDNFGVSFDGALYIFKRDSENDKFVLIQKNLGDLTKLERKNDRLGYFLGINGNGSIIQCSSQHDGATENDGAAWFFQKDGNSYPLIDKKTGILPLEKFGKTNSITFDGNFSAFGTDSSILPKYVKIYKNNFVSGTVKFEKKTPLYSGVNGKLIGILKSTDFYNYKAEVNLYESDIKYFNGFSEIYKNGIRQTLGSDYIELANLDINTGVGFFDQKSDLIYNNEDLFNL